MIAMPKTAFLSLLLIAAVPADGFAQGLLFDLIGLLGESAVVPTPSHGGAHFLLSEEAAPDLLSIKVLAHAAAQIANPTSASSSGGFLFEFDRASGVFLRKSNTFGPAFAERAQTLGRGRWSVGGTYQRLTGVGYEGRDFDRGLPFHIPHLDLPFPPGGAVPAPFFEGDVLENVVFVDLAMDRFTIFANYGATSRLDVGVTLPIVSLTVDAQVHSRIIRQSTADLPTVHAFDEGGTSETIQAIEGSSTGFGDLLLRAKYLAYDGERVGAGFGVDLRLPTADAENLLGSDATQAKLYFVLSGARQRFLPHVNFGYTLSHGGVGDLVEMPDELTYALGTEFAATPTLTLIGDVLGRSLRGFGRYHLGLQQFPFQTSDGRLGTGVFEQYEHDPGNLHLMEGTLGFKWNPWPNILVSGHVLFPLSNAGLNGGLSPVFAFEYSFGQR